MTYTPHGHHINGTTRTDENYGVVKTKCGGPGRCKVCNHFMNKVYKDGRMSVVKVLAPKEQDLKVAKVTLEDMDEIAKWCEGRVKDDYDAMQTTSYGYPKYVEVIVNYRPVKAQIGDYIIKHGNFYTTMPATTFELFFETI